MKSSISVEFRKAFARLPARVKASARTAYAHFEADPQHPSLRFKRVHPTKPIYSVRIGPHYRALGVRTGDDIVWFWIGTHAEYDRLTS